jgi:hypothetical protein
MREIDQPAKQVRVGLIGIGDKARIAVFAECCPDLHPVLASQVTAGQWEQGAFFERHVPQNVIGKAIRCDEKASRPVASLASKAASASAAPRHIGEPDGMLFPQLRDQSVRHTGALHAAGRTGKVFLGMMQLLRETHRDRNTIARSNLKSGGRVAAAFARPDGAVPAPRRRASDARRK